MFDILEVENAVKTILGYIAYQGPDSITNLADIQMFRGKRGLFNVALVQAFNDKKIRCQGRDDKHQLIVELIPVGANPDYVPSNGKIWWSVSYEGGRFLVPPIPEEVMEATILAAKENEVPGHNRARETAAFVCSCFPEFYAMKEDSLIIQIIAPFAIKMAWKQQA